MQTIPANLTDETALALAKSILETSDEYDPQYHGWRAERLSGVLMNHPGETIIVERLSDYAGRRYKTGTHYKIGQSSFPSARNYPHQIWAHVGCVRGWRGWVAAS